MIRNKAPYDSYWIDALVLIAVVILIVYVVYRVNTVLVYNWDWSFIPGYLFRWDEELQSYAPNLLIMGLFKPYGWLFGVLSLQQFLVLSWG